MADLEYTVTNQGISTSKTSRLVSGTIGVYTVKFTFNNVWDGLEKWATFDPIPGTPYKQPLDANGECTIPGEVMGGVYLRIGVFGLAEGQAYPTIWASKLPLEEGCFVNVPPSDWPEPSPLLEDVVKVSAQTFTDAQKTQARTNIGAAGSTEMTTALAGKVDKPVGATEGNVAVIGSNQNIADSGVSKDNLILAPQLASNNIKTDSVPYIYRQTGGGIGVGNREYDSIVGGTINWQQIQPNGNFETATVYSQSGGSVSASNNVLSYTVSSIGASYYNNRVIFPTMAHQVKGTERFLFYVEVKYPIAGKISYSGMTGNTIRNYKEQNLTANTWTPLFAIGGNARAYVIDRFALNFYPNVNSWTVGDVIQIRLLQVFELTTMFGSTIADTLYNMEVASEGSGIAYFKKMFPNAYYPYTATQSLESVSGLSSHQMKDGNGNVIAEYTLDSSLTLRGVAILDENNNIAFDGDTYAPDGTVTRRYGIITLDGTQTPTLVNWRASETSVGFAFAYSLTKNKFPVSDYGIIRAISTYGQISSYNDLYNKTVNDGFGFYKTNAYGLCFRISDTTLTTADAVKAYLQAHPITIVYALADPTTETAEPYESLQICDPLGTEEYITTGICPVGHSTRYPENQVAKLDGLPSDFSRIIAPTEIEFKATRTYTVGRLMIIHNVLYKAKTSIAIGATLTVGTNIEETTLDEVIASL